MTSQNTMEPPRHIAAAVLAVRLLLAGAVPAAVLAVEPPAEKVPIDPYLPLCAQFPISPSIEEVLLGVAQQMPRFLGDMDDGDPIHGVPLPVLLRTSTRAEGTEGPVAGITPRLPRARLDERVEPVNPSMFLTGAGLAPPTDRAGETHLPRKATSTGSFNHPAEPLPVSPARESGFVFPVLALSCPIGPFIPDAGPGVLPKKLPGPPGPAACLRRASLPGIPALDEPTPTIPLSPDRGGALVAAVSFRPAPTDALPKAPKPVRTAVRHDATPPPLSRAATPSLSATPPSRAARVVLAYPEFAGPDGVLPTSTTDWSLAPPGQVPGAFHPRTGPKTPVGQPTAVPATPTAIATGTVPTAVAVDAPRTSPTGAARVVLSAPASSSNRAEPAPVLPVSSPSLFPDTPGLDQRTGLLLAHFEARKAPAELRREIDRFSPGDLIAAIRQTPLDHPHLPLLGTLADKLLAQQKNVLGPAGPLSDAVRYRVARALAEKGDARCVPVLDSLLEKNKAPGRTWAPELFALGLYYRRTGDFPKAAETYVRAAAACASADAAVDARLEAARAFAIAGDTEHAAKLYSQVTTAECDNGWIRGMALYDCADAFRRKKQYEKALEILARPIAGKRADQVAVALAFIRGRVFLDMGDRQQAADAFRRTVELYDKLAVPLDAAGLGDVRARAEKLCKQLEAGPEQAPFTVKPGTLTLEPDEDERWVGHVDVFARQPFALEVRPGNSAVKCRLGGAWVCRTLEARRRIKIIVDDRPPDRQSFAIVVLDGKHPEQALTVPVRFRAAHQTSAGTVSLGSASGG